MLAVSATADPAGVPLRVAIVDDSAVVRGLVGRWLVEAGFLVAGRYRDGQDALDHIAEAAPDIVILDIEMPGMDGLAALPGLLKIAPNAAVIMASTISRRGAEVTLKALALGAADYIAKPESRFSAKEVERYRSELIGKVDALGGRARSRPRAVPPAPDRVVPRAARAPAPGPDEGAPKLRPFGNKPVRAVVVGASTGGPQALVKLFQALGPKLGRVPVLVTQHMPATFTALLAEHIGKAAGMPAREGADGEPVKAGTIYVAPGGRHMRVVKAGSGAAIALDDGAAVHFCKPAVDPLFESAAAAYGSGCYGVVLTGMGYDGAEGARGIVAAGGDVVAQDEATSVVWGMPGAVARAGLASAVAPIDMLARLIAQRL